MAAGDIHTVPRGDRWANVFEDGDRLIVSAGTKETAARMGRELARLRGVRHVVHDAAGGPAPRRSPAADTHG